MGIARFNNPVATLIPVPNYAGAGLVVDPGAAQDPSYLAFMRGAGYNEAEIMAELARKQGSLTRQVERAKPRFADETRQAEAGVQSDFATRGLYRSGARMVHQVDAGNVVRRNEQEFLSGVGDQRGDLIADSMKQIAEGRRQAADMALTSRQTAAINAANARADAAGNGPVVGHSDIPGGTFGAPAPPRPKVPKGPIKIPSLTDLGALGG